MLQAFSLSKAVNKDCLLVWGGDEHVFIHFLLLFCLCTKWLFKDDDVPKYHSTIFSLVLFLISNLLLLLSFNVFFLCIYPSWDLWHFMSVWLNVFHPLGKLLAIISSNTTSAHSLLFPQTPVIHMLDLFTLKFFSLFSLLFFLENK